MMHVPVFAHWKQVEMARTEMQLEMETQTVLRSCNLLMRPSEWREVRLREREKCDLIAQHRHSLASWRPSGRLQVSIGKALDAR